MHEELCPPLVPENCDACFELQFIDCATIQINAGVTPNTVFFLLVEDHFGKQFRTQVLTDGSGNFVINGDLFPAGFFNTFGGKYEILITTDNQFVNIVPMNIGLYGAPFNCALLSFDIPSGQICCNTPVEIADGIRIINSLFFDGSNDTYQFTVVADEAGTYTLQTLVNVATIVILKNAAPVTVPFSIVVGDTVDITITRTILADSKVTLTGKV